jgi:hypothetical protein
MSDDRCSFLCPIHLEPCILKKYHRDSACLCRDILECKATRQLEEVFWKVSGDIP